MRRPPTIFWVQICLAALLFLQVLAIISASLQLNLLSQPTFGQEQAKANDAREAMLGYVHLAVFLVTAVVFGRWIVRSHKFVRSRGAHGLSMTPGWAVGYFFIPFINLVKPYVGMKELWQASQDPRSHFVQEVPVLLPTWWTLWIVNYVVSPIASRISLNARGIEAFKAATVADLASSVVGIALCVVTWRLVRGIDGNFARLERPPPLPVETHTHATR